MSAIRAAAAAVAESKVNAEQCAVVLKDANAGVDEIRGRLESLAAERDQIKAARLAGEVSSDQGARLAALAVDTEGLAEIMVERQAVQTTAASEFGRLSQAVTAAGAMLAHSTDQAMLADLRVIADELQTRLLATIVQITEVARRGGGSRAAWTPSSVFAGRLRALDLEGASRA
jgi:hypothetical protein